MTLRGEQDIQVRFPPQRSLDRIPEKEELAEGPVLL
jgi:hypothetical protein